MLTNHEEMTNCDLIDLAQSGNRGLTELVAITEDKRCGEAAAACLLDAALLKC